MSKYRQRRRQRRSLLETARLVVECALLLALGATLLGASCSSLFTGRSLVFGIEGAAILLWCGAGSREEVLELLSASIGVYRATSPMLAAPAAALVGEGEGLSETTVRVALSSGRRRDAEGPLPLPSSSVRGVVRCWFVGSWAGATLAALDWDVWWQYWPLPSCVLGLLLPLLWCSAARIGALYPCRGDESGQRFRSASDNATHKVM